MKYDELKKLQNSVSERARKYIESMAVERTLPLSFDFFYSFPKSQLNNKKQSMLVLFYRNCIYLSAAYELLLTGLVDPSVNNMRTVFETICWQYAYICDDEEFKNFELIGQLEDKKLTSLETKNWSNTKERELENLRRKFNFQKMLKKIYGKDQESFFAGPYWMFSHKSHTSLIGANFNTPDMEGLSIIDKNEDELRNFILTLLYLISENLLCFLNSFKLELDHDKKQQLLSLIGSIHKDLPHDFSLAPDKKEVEYKIKIRYENNI